MTEPFRVTDRRASRLVTGESVAAARAATGATLPGVPAGMTPGRRMPREGIAVPSVGDDVPGPRRSSTTATPRQDALSAASRGYPGASRRLNRLRRTAGGSGGSGGGTEVSFATGRPRDPMFYWRQNNLPYDMSKEDELRKVREFCNTPEAPIWMGDYSFKPIGEVQPGDEVIGWFQKEGGRTHLTRTKVLAVKRRMAPEVVKVTMESGRTFRCTPDHKWANPFYSPNAQGLPASNLATQKWVNVKPGRTLRHVIDPTPELESEKERLTAAWLGGIYDGEGSEMHFAQSPTHNPDVYEGIATALESLGYPVKRERQGVYIRGAGRQTRQHFVNFLNQGKPIRRQTTAIDKELMTARFGTKDKVATIEHEGPGEVVSMQTETGNYVAWGYASSNCRLLYMTHPIISACIDIFSKFPLQGMKFTCKDKQLEDFHSELFFEQLNYEDYLLDIGREYWITGEAWPLGSFNEIMGVWDDDELLNPNDVEVERSPLIKDPRFLIRLPETLRKVIIERSPKWEYEKLMQDYPELSAFSSQDALMPVSNVLLKQLKFKGDTFHKRGVPILMRGFRSVMQEEMLMAAMDAVADRLYTPLILAKLGASAQDLGTEAPWIPTEEDLGNFEESLDAALAADFRVITHNFALDMAPVFGRENMPDMTADFDRIEDRILQVFGLSRTMLQGADSGETYAADALNRDVVAQLLTHYQRLLKNFYRDRALIVAEAQEHYDYDVRAGKRYVKMEEVLEYDDNGDPQIIEQPKLLIPDLEFDSMSLTDENVERQFLEGLNAAGVPVPIKRRIQGTGMDFEEMIEERKQEQVEMAKADQEARRETYTTLRDAALPIDETLLADFQPKAVQAQQSNSEQGPIPTLGVNPPGTPALAPTQDMLAEDQEDDATAMDGTDAQAPQMAAILPMDAPAQGDQRPPESDEQRATMPQPPPRAASRRDRLHDDAEPYSLPRTGRIRAATMANREAVPVYMTTDEEGNEVPERPEHQLPRGKFGAPGHVGMRRHVRVGSARWHEPKNEEENSPENDPAEQQEYGT